MPTAFKAQEKREDTQKAATHSITAATKLAASLQAIVNASLHATAVRSKNKMLSSSRKTAFQ